MIRWDDDIELPDHPISLRELLDILLLCLNKEERDSFAEELSSGGWTVDEFDLDLDE